MGWTKGVEILRDFRGVDFSCAFCPSASFTVAPVALSDKVSSSHPSAGACIACAPCMSLFLTFVIFTV